MFTKYINKFGKAEAEWVMEVLDLHDGDEQKAKDAILASINNLLDNRSKPELLSSFDRGIDAAFFASSRWWQIGLAKLRELGKIPPAAVVSDLVSK